MIACIILKKLSVVIARTKGTADNIPNSALEKFMLPNIEPLPAP